MSVGPLAGDGPEPRGSSGSAGLIAPPELSEPPELPEPRKPPEPPEPPEPPALPLRNALRAVALFEAGKGSLVLLAGFGVLTLLHRDLGAMAESLVAHLHLNPASHLPTVFIDSMGKLDGKEVWFAAGAALYAAVRFVEAGGLWFHRRWAEWFAAASGAIYVPFEIRAFAIHPSGLSAGLLLVNLLIVGLMLRELRRGKRAG